MVAVDSSSFGPGLLSMWTEPVGPIFDVFAAPSAASSCSMPAEHEEAVVVMDNYTYALVIWSWFWMVSVGLYVLSEFVFYLYFHYHLIPIASQCLPSDQYHDYPEPDDRVRLFRRILLRLQQKASRQAQSRGHCATQCHQQIIREFCLPWFDYLGTAEPATVPNVGSKEVVPVAPSGAKSAPPPLTMVSMASTVSSSVASRCSSTSMADSASLDSGSSNNEDANSVQSSDDIDVGVPAAATAAATTPFPLWTIPGLKRPAVADFFSWAFFAKDTPDLTPTEQSAMEECFHSLQELTGLVVDESSQEALYYPRRLSLEKVQAMHRPWLVYAGVAMSQLFQRTILLPWLGYQRVTASNVNLTAWFRPAASKENQKDVCLFFHGLAPSGLICYAPMLEAILGKRQESLVMFENPSVMCQFHALPNFQVLTEGETIMGIQDILKQLKMSTKEHSLTVMGHSFGSCPVTWVLRRRHEFAARIKHVVLLDPVTLLLSDPSVMTRFLYERDDRAKVLIRFVVASELFTEFYLRRHFCWYNSELWLEDYFSKDASTMEQNNDPAKWTFVLSGRDEIVPSQSVQDHISCLKNEYNFDAAKIVYWPHAKHANCVMSPLRWKLMRSFLFCKDDDDEKPKQD